MSKHTPGPWYPVGGWVEVEDDDIADICTCHPADFGQGHLERSDKEIMANARLIAAAPDMLKVLKYLVRRFPAEYPGMDDARAVIARATWEPSKALTQSKQGERNDPSKP